MTNLSKKQIVFLGCVFLFVISIAFIALYKRDYQNNNKDTVTIGNQTFTVEVADTEEERKNGLMNIESLDTNVGMLFMYDDEGYRTFWMKDTLIPLDMIFINEDFKIVKIFSNALPCKEDPCTYYRCEKRAKYVLEINAGLSDQYGFKMGDSVEIEAI